MAPQHFALLVATVLFAAHVSAAPAQVPPPNSPLAVICKQVDLKTFCDLLTKARDNNDTTAKMMGTTGVVATVLAPTDRGFVLTIKTMRKFLGVDDVAELKDNADLLSKFVKSHVVLGRASDTRSWRAGNILTNALTNALQMVEGLKMNLFLKGPVNTSKVVRRNLKATKTLVQVMEVPIYFTP
uniref:FAS1 domain-containing protein n=1 Tax=Chlamydomonas leiostraca TaxID=1034604 RepID=A0A7S0WYX6_9CHLO|eukprot:CAMPEP_0202868804 /NCGR_PEP_ID=MMETSP1391-20130828/11095_1 /ASSEMBLY_ACC=CAM_ASM_000867 /TAXON_ID=1034604 /ORGANISM="Chlamydomonas leiostraca, Strain SAG 11-49" /LENGTH=183 /DNA_ID=CAMNT_0049549013 /DNA_START=14 /DNA_END=565 /DNA_ORIENTATION=+